MTSRVALATCAPLPEPDPDEALLVAALSERGLDARVVPWDHPTDWTAFDVVVLRSTWDYHHRPAQFLAWAEAVARTTRLMNPPEVVRWNLHKGYLLELDARGVPAVPTALVRAGSRTTLAEVLAERGFFDVVVKPAVSAGSHLTMRTWGATPEAEAHLARVLAVGDALVQPYATEVEASGERAIVWIDGQITHSVRKTPRFLTDDERVSEALAVEPDARAFAERAIAAAGFGDLLYARVDVVRDGDGLHLMELELMEPSLFLLQHPPALGRLADAIARRA
jgi:glutathione synthase/RimK-type ligase-like ATP-grasp enzyme